MNSFACNFRFFVFHKSYVDIDIPLNSNHLNEYKKIYSRIKLFIEQCACVLYPDIFSVLFGIITNANDIS